MRALGWILSGWRCRFANPYIKTYGQLLRRITGGIVTSLIFQVSPDYVLPGLDRAQRSDVDVKFEVSRIHTEFFVRRECEAHFAAFRVCDAADHNVGSGANLECGWDQKL